MRALALALTVLTGFSGLVYEVAWQKYLATLLGSHSEATAAVLGLFLGGLSLGYVLFGRVSQRLARGEEATGRLLVAYGVVEGSIGLLALAFPWTFQAAQGVSLWLPHTSPGLGFALDVMLSALLIGPPSVLMGGTIPLLTQGLARDAEDATRYHALVYSFNTAGAFLGAVAASFVVIPALGLAGAVALMGLINLVAGLVFGLLGSRQLEAAPPAPETPAASPAEEATLTGTAFVGFAFAALLAGFAMMTLQTTLNRIGGLSLGASQHTFSMVVATFVLCIALGSFAVSRLERIQPIHVVLSQWLLVLYLILLYPFVEYAPYAAHVLRALFATNVPSFYAYHFAIFFSVLAVALIPLALSGALLPLLFHHLRDHVGELGAMAGRLYSWNTLGSLLGALIGGYAIFFWLDLHHTYRIAVLALGVMATILTRLTLPKFARVAWIALATLLLALWSQPAWDGQRMALGIFRHHEAMTESFDGPEAFYDVYVRARFGKKGFVPFYDDDPSMSVAVFATPLNTGYFGLSIVNNGKVDGMIPGDNQTTGLLALLPALFSQHAERAFVIGYGTGMTVGELAALESMEEVVVAEISPAVIEAAPLFEKGNRGAATSPKTRLLHADAYRALLRSDEQYDMIVSEPSNPWVTGVEMLYSREFLVAAREQLREGGVYAQWFHSYETSDECVELVLNTYRQVFDHVAVWQTGVDFILLGFRDGATARNVARVVERFERPDINAQMEAIGFGSLPKLLAHEVVPVGVLGAAELDPRVHTLSHPLLAHAAAQGFYRGGDGTLPKMLHTQSAAAGAENSLVRRYAEHVGGRLPAEERARMIREACSLDRAACTALAAAWLREEPSAPELGELLDSLRESETLASHLEPDRLAQIAQLFDVRSLPNAAHGYESADYWARLFREHYSHAAPFDGRALVSIWAHCAGDERCRTGAARDRGLGIPIEAPAPSGKPGQPVALR